MADLQFDVGVVRHTINGKVDVDYNPTDFSFAERLFTLFSEMEKKQEERQEEVKAVKTAQETFDLAMKYDTEMRQLVDEAIGKPVCEDLFGTMNVFAMADGLPVWCNLILCLLENMDENVVKETEKINPRLQKYLDRRKR